MEPAPTVFEILRSEKDPAADTALLKALETADLPTSHAIVETLLARDSRTALRGLVSSYHLLDESLHQVLLSETDRLFSVLREASQSRIEQVRLNVLEVIRRGCIYRASYLTDAGLRDRSRRVREAAAETLSFLADELIRTSAAPARDQPAGFLDPDGLRQRMKDLEARAEDRRQVVGALEAGLASFDVHLQPRVVEAAMWFVDDLSPAFWSLMTVPGSRLAQVAVGTLNNTAGPRVVPFAMVGLSYSEFRPHLVRLLATASDPAFLAEWLHQSWRLAQPKLARAMLPIKDLACARRQAWDLLAAGDSQRHLARWIAATGLPPQDKIDLLRDLQRRADHVTRRAALWVLTAIPDARVNAVLRQIAEEDEPEFSGIARRELARRCRGQMPLDRMISDDLEEAAAKTAATAEGAAVTFERYFAVFDVLSREDQVRLGQQMLRTSPSGAANLAAALGSADLPERLRALRIITLLKLADSFAEKLYQLSHDPQPEVRSAVVAALSQVSSATSRLILRTALNDQDMRVQAKAVEAVERFGETAPVQELLPKLESPDNRVRANAVKALLKLGVREAAETLLQMLRAGSRTQRVSALWLIERMGLFGLAEKVVRLAQADPDVVVREKARALAGRLQDEDPGEGLSPLPRPAAEEAVAS